MKKVLNMPGDQQNDLNIFLANENFKNLVQCTFIFVISLFKNSE